MPFVIVHSNPAVKQSALPSFAICHPEVNDVIAKLSLVDKVYIHPSIMALNQLMMTRVLYRWWGNEIPQKIIIASTAIYNREHNYRFIVESDIFVLQYVHKTLHAHVPFACTYVPPPKENKSCMKLSSYTLDLGHGHWLAAQICTGSESMINAPHQAVTVCYLLSL